MTHESLTSKTLQSLTTAVLLSTDRTVHTAAGDLDLQLHTAAGLQQSEYRTVCTQFYDVLTFFFHAAFFRPTSDNSSKTKKLKGNQKKEIQLN